MCRDKLSRKPGKSHRFEVFKLKYSYTNVITDSGADGALHISGFMTV